MKKWCTASNVEFNAEVVNNKELQKTILDSIVKIAKENNFNSLEKPKQMKLLLEPWTIESDMLTPTMKMKRNIAKEVYKNDVEKMYQDGPLQF